jgi:hypothetical protein
MEIVEMNHHPAAASEVRRESLKPRRGHGHQGRVLTARNVALDRSVFSPSDVSQIVVNDTTHFPTPKRSLGAAPAWGMSPLDRRRITRWIGDAFAILCVRVSGYSKSEKHLRLGFETILRQLGSSPLGAITKAPLPLYNAPSATLSDLRQIIRALDSCVATFSRYGAMLNATERRIEILVRATRRFAEEELHSRTLRPIERDVLTLDSVADMRPRSHQTHSDEQPRDTSSGNAG